MLLTNLYVVFFALAVPAMALVITAEERTTAAAVDNHVGGFIAPNRRK